MFFNWFDFRKKNRQHYQFSQLHAIFDCLLKINDWHFHHFDCLLKVIDCWLFLYDLSEDCSCNMICKLILVDSKFQYTVKQKIVRVIYSMPFLEYGRVCCFLGKKLLELTGNC